MTAGLSVPYAEADERAVVGIVIGNPFALDAVIAIVEASSFYFPLHARLFAVAEGLAARQCHLSAAERVAAGWGRAMRASEAARLADVAVGLVDELMSEAPVLTGVEPYARRVAEAARARRIMAAAADAYNHIG